MSGTELTEQQALFCLEYVKDFNGYHAAVRAGYAENSARMQASRLLTKDNVQHKVRKLIEERSSIVKIDGQYVLKRLHEIDQLDILDIMEDDLSKFKPLNEWPKAWRISINAVDIKRMIDADSVDAVVEKIKWPDKTRNLELLGKHVDVNAFVEKQQIDGELKVSSTLAERLTGGSKK